MAKLRAVLLRVSDVHIDVKLHMEIGMVQIEESKLKSDMRFEWPVILLIKLDIA